VGGLVLRDLLAGDAPRIMRPGVFIAAAAFIGTTTFVVLVEATGIASGQAQILAIVVVFAVRIASVRFAWRTRPATDLTDRVWGLWSRPEPDPSPGTTADDGRAG
jgi:uncharacterized membrane protein YeiH